MVRMRTCMTMIMGNGRLCVSVGSMILSSHVLTFDLKLTGLINETGLVFIYYQKCPRPINEGGLYLRGAFNREYTVYIYYTLDILTVIERA